MMTCAHTEAARCPGDNDPKKVSYRSDIYDPALTDSTQTKLIPELALSVAKQSLK